MFLNKDSSNSYWHWKQFNCHCPAFLTARFYQHRLVEAINNYWSKTWPSSWHNKPTLWLVSRVNSGGEDYHANTRWKLFLPAHLWRKLIKSSSLYLLCIFVIFSNQHLRRLHNLGNESAYLKEITEWTSRSNSFWILLCLWIPHFPD